ncbi:MAG TPA: flagellar basal body P-ring formation chaperone FlgA [Opitutaceae bacterium]|nr:flagellar basal body P-ring formation chaperone FlgA [Opitutaceae bacterium]
MKLIKNLITLAVISAFIAIRMFADAAPGLTVTPAPDQPAFSQQLMEKVLTHDVAAHFNLEGDFQLSLEHPWTPERAPAAGWTFSVVEFPMTPSSVMLVRCQLQDAQGTQESSVLVHAALWRDAWAVKTPIEAGSAFDTTRLEGRRSDMLREHDLLPATVGDGGYIFARAVQVGRVLTWHDVSRHQQVRKGDLVEVTAADGELKISMKVLALESGVTGDTITVRNPDSKKDFSAMVTDENHVQVQF